MEGRNVIIAIALSLSVILFWEAFMTVPKKELQNNSTSQSKQFKEENDNNEETLPILRVLKEIYTSYAFWRIGPLSGIAGGTGLAILGPVSYTHLTLPTIYSV